MTYDPDFPNCMPVNVEEAALQGLKVYPTLLAPGAPVWISGDVAGGPMNIRLLNTLGQQLQSWRLEGGFGGETLRLDLPMLATGVHYLQIQTKAGGKTIPVVIR
jgi:hypothetical protein